MKQGRMAYMLCLEGTVSLSLGGQQVTLTRHDACEIQSLPDVASGDLSVTATSVEQVEGGEQAAHVLVFEMAQAPNAGRTDL